MRIGLVNLITKTADVAADGSVLSTTNLTPGTDGDINIVELGRRMARRGHEVTIYVADTYRPKERSDLAQPYVEYLPTRLPLLFPPSLAPLTPSLAPVLRKQKLDVVQSGEVFQPGTMLSWTATRDPGTNMFVWQELDTYMRGPLGWAQKRFYGAFGRTMAEHCGGVIPRSRSARGHLLETGFPDHKMSPVVHSGVDTQLYRPMNKHESRQRFGIDEDRNVLLSIGRFHDNKGMDILLKAMAHLRNWDPDALLVIKGAGPQEGALREMARALGLEDNVEIDTSHLARRDMPVLYNCADLLAIASRVDLFPFTAIEAISCGVPVATSFGRGLKTDIVDEGAGAMIRPAPKAMAEDLLSLLEDPVRLDSMGHRARQLALRDFDFEVAVDRLLSIYGGGCS